MVSRHVIFYLCSPVHSKINTAAPTLWRYLQNTIYFLRDRSQLDHRISHSRSVRESTYCSSDSGGFWRTWTRPALRSRWPSRPRPAPTARSRVCCNLWEEKNKRRFLSGSDVIKSLSSRRCCSISTPLACYSTLFLPSGFYCVTGKLLVIV